MNLRRWERAPGRPAWRRRQSAVCVLQELVEYYQSHSLKESFKQLDTTLKYPYKSRERAASRPSSRSPGSAHPRHTGAPCGPAPCPPALAQGSLGATLTSARGSAWHPRPEKLLPDRRPPVVSGVRGGMPL